MAICPTCGNPAEGRCEVDGTVVVIVPAPPIEPEGSAEAEADAPKKKARK